MSDCPSQDVLLAMLDERVETEDLEELENHIEYCEPCQARLELMTRGQGGKTTQKDVSARQGRSERSTVGSVSPVEHGEEALGWRLAGVGDPGAKFVAEEGSTDRGTADDDPADDERTVTQGGVEKEAGPAAAARRRPEWPSLSGYTILSQLGEGGMGVVYKARQLGLNRLVALKMIRGGSAGATGPCRPVPNRSRGGRPAPPSEHHPDLRNRRGRRLAVRVAGTARGRKPGGPHRRYPAAGSNVRGAARNAGPWH